MPEAQPLALSITSAYEKPPTKMMPRKLSREARPLSRSLMVMSHGSIPAACTAAAISRSPLLPSSRRTATRTLLVAAMTSGNVLAGVKLRFHTGLVRPARLAASASTHSSAACRRSSTKEVASQASRSTGMLSASTGLPPTATATLWSAAVEPIAVTVRPAALNAATTASSFSGETSTRRPSSSANSAARSPPCSPAGACGRSRLRPVLPANAISSAATTRPPSLTSWPALIRRPSSSDCVVSNAALSAAEPMSGTSLPSWLVACASAEPPRRRRPSPRSTSSRRPEPGSLRSGVTVSVMSGQRA
mmetsp:Transcript_1373/g.3213  ORF Transcript_1373/g.3213 Transcript_1373/m.3213 type:complete len:305 (-) Transcript_1373:1023-1937(-)